MEGSHRLLEIVRRELDAADARIEIGGRDPDDPRLVWRRMPEGERVVAIFDAPPGEPGRLGEKLDTLLDAFRETTRHTVQRSRVDRPLRHAIDEALVALAERADAAQAVIVDGSSPVLWGSSDPTRTEDEDVEAMIDDARLAEDAAARELDLAPLVGAAPSQASHTLRQVGVEHVDPWLQSLRALHARNPDRDAERWRRYFSAARAVAQVRRGAQHEVSRQSDFGYLCRSFANLYRLVLAFEGGFSELHASAAAIHALPELDRLVRALPPVDPDRGGGGGGGRSEAQVVRLPRR